MKKLLTIVLTVSILSSFAQDKPTAFKIGDSAPNLMGKNHLGKMVNLKELIKNGKVIVMFYRGAWCGYCNKYMSELEATQ